MREQVVLCIDAGIVGYSYAGCFDIEQVIRCRY